KNIWMSESENIVSYYFGIGDNSETVTSYYPKLRSTVESKSMFKTCSNFSPDVAEILQMNSTKFVRPWYLAATTVRKNAILVLDISDSLLNSAKSNELLDTMKLSVKMFLDNSFNYGDFITIVTYTETMHSYSSILLR